MDEQGEDHTGGAAAAVCAGAVAAVCPVIREGEGEVVMIVYILFTIWIALLAFAGGYFMCKWLYEEAQKVEHQRVLDREEIVNEIFKKLKDGK